MQVTINVDETMFAEVIDKELKALSSDDLKEIIFFCCRGISSSIRL